MADHMENRGDEFDDTRALVRELVGGNQAGDTFYEYQETKTYIETSKEINGAGVAHDFQDSAVFSTNASFGCERCSVLTRDHQDEQRIHVEKENELREVVHKLRSQLQESQLSYSKLETQYHKHQQQWMLERMKLETTIDQLGHDHDRDAQRTQELSSLLAARESSSANVSRQLQEQEAFDQQVLQQKSDLEVRLGISQTDVSRLEKELEESQERCEMTIAELEQQRKERDVMRTRINELNKTVLEARSLYQGLASSHQEILNRLQHENRSLADETTTLRRTCETLRIEIESHQKTIITIRGETEQLRAQEQEIREELQDTIAHHQSIDRQHITEVSRLETQVASLEENLQVIQRAHQDDRLAYDRERANASEAASMLKEQLNKERAAKDTLDTEYQSQSFQLQSIQKQLGQSQMDLQMSIERHTILKKEYTELQTHFQSLREQHEALDRSLHDGLREREKETNETQRQLQEEQSRNQMLSEMLQKAESASNEATHRVSTLRSEKISLQTLIEEHEVTIHSLTDDLAKARSQIGRLDKELTQSRTESSKLTIQVSSLEQRITEDLQSKTNEIAALKKSLAHEQQVIVRDQQHLEDLRKQLKEANSLVVKYEAERDSSKREADSSRKAYELMKREVYELHKRVQELEQNLREYAFESHVELPDVSVINVSDIDERLPTIEDDQLRALLERHSTRLRQLKAVLRSSKDIRDSMEASTPRRESGESNNSTHRSVHFSEHSSTSSPVVFQHSPLGTSTGLNSAQQIQSEMHSTYDHRTSLEEPGPIGIEQAEDDFEIQGLLDTRGNGDIGTTEIVTSRRHEDVIVQSADDGGEYSSTTTVVTTTREVTTTDDFEKYIASSHYGVSD